MAKYEVGDRVSTIYDDKPMIIIDLRPRATKWPYVAIIDTPQARGGKYKLGDHVITGKLGEADEDTVKEAADDTPDDSELHQWKRHCERQARMAEARGHEDTALKWLHLADVEPGETVLVLHRGAAEPCKLKRIMTQGRKYDFVVIPPRCKRGYKKQIHQLAL